MGSRARRRRIGEVSALRCRGSALRTASASATSREFEQLGGAARRGSAWRRPRRSPRRVALIDQDRRPRPPRRGRCPRR
jgi:hypothetical protein